jgi:hypothetical protein
MKKFRFLFPLFILTLIVISVSYGVRNYMSSKDGDTQTPITQTNGDEQTTPDSDAQETQDKSGGFLARIFGAKKTSTTQKSSGAVTVTITPMPSPISTSFSETQVTVPINEQRDVFISLDTGTNPPTAYTFNMHFDPKSINVVKIEPGDIWQSSTIFTKANKIDNTKGTLTFSAGQALGTEKGNGKTLVKISVKSKATTETGTELTIDDTSKFAYVGLDYAIPLRSKSLQIQVTK